jgi:hypothetical protein
MTDADLPRSHWHPVCLRAAASACLLVAAASAQDPVGDPAADSPDGNRLHLQIGTGRLRHDTEGNAGGDDATDASWFRLAYEYARKDGFGGGARLDIAGSDDDLFDDDGSPSSAGLIDLFAHATWTQASDGWIVPLRFGVSLHDYTIEEEASGDSVRWSTFGFRVEAEPEWRIASSEEVCFSLAAPIDVLVGLTWVETQPESEDWSTSMLGADVGLMLRVGTDAVRFELGYRRTWLDYDETDAQAGMRLRGIEIDADFFVLGFLLRF